MINWNQRWTSNIKFLSRESDLSRGTNLNEDTLLNIDIPHKEFSLHIYF